VAGRPAANARRRGLARIAFCSPDDTTGTDHWTFYDAAADHWRLELTEEACDQRLRIIPSGKGA